MRKQIQKVLAFLARKVVLKYKPKVVGITGSVGKTSARSAVSLALEGEYTLRVSQKNFNNEFGLPFTILGVDSPGRNPFLWIYVVLKAFALWLLPVPYPQVLVLEMGIDHPGDMSHLLNIVVPDVGVITSIGESHYENFDDPRGIEEEKGKLAEALSDTGILIVNADDEIAFRQKNKTRAKILSYGKSLVADLRVLDFSASYESEIKTKIRFGFKDKEFFVDFYAVGLPHVYAVASGVAVGLAMGLEVSNIEAGISNYTPSPGRLFAHPGIKDSVLLDDSYNASPVSVRAALEVLRSLPGVKKIAVLGDMFELGSISENAHRALAGDFLNSGANMLVTVGEQGKLIAESVLEKGFDGENVKVFRDVFSAVYFLQKYIERGDVILVKGSQGMRMEKISKELLRDPETASEVLCRQYGKWLNS